MDFFSSQDQARKRTGWLVFYFLLAVLAISLTVATLVTVGAYMAMTWESTGNGQGQVDLSGAVFGLAFVATLLLIGGGSLVESQRIRHFGGAGVATRLGGRRLAPNTTDLAERRLLNVVEEMALASGVPTPPVYLLDSESSINAFAAGFQSSDAVLGFTRGAIDHLTREELQAVVGHEFSHILNGDMRMNLKLMGTVQGILFISLIGTAMIRMMGLSGAGRSRRRNSKGEGGIIVLALIGLGLVIIGYIGVFFGRLIKSAVSRQREYLADAAAVQFTRNPQGLAGALKKIGAQGKAERVKTPYAEQASHLFFGNAKGASYAGGMLATHPPLAVRIRRLDPSFDGKFPPLRPKGQALRPEPAAPAKARAAPPPVPGLFGAGAVMQTIGAPMLEHMKLAQSLLLALPAMLREAAREPSGARAVIYALLLDEEAGIRTRQWEVLEEHADPAVLAETRELADRVRQTERAVRIAMVDLAVPALKTLSPEQYLTFRRNVDALAAADDDINLFEFALLHTLRHHLDAHFNKPRSAAAQIYSVRGLGTECSVLFSMMARLDMEIGEPKADIQFMQEGDCSLMEVDRALGKMATASPAVKKQIIEAGLECLLTNGKISATEAELFRAVSAALDVPVPPMASPNSP